MLEIKSGAGVTAFLFVSGDGLLEILPGTESPAGVKYFSACLGRDFFESLVLELGDDQLLSFFIAQEIALSVVFYRDGASW